MMDIVEPTIIGKHNLDISTVQNLANDIASRLPINIEYGKYNDGYIKMGEIITDDKYPLYILADQSSIHENNEVSYALECDDYANSIYKEITELHLPFEIEYKTLEESHNENLNGLLDEPMVAEYFRNMKSLGARETYIFANHYFENYFIKFGYESLGSWQTVINQVKSHKSYFVEPKK